MNLLQSKTTASLLLVATLVGGGTLVTASFNPKPAQAAQNVACNCVLFARSRVPSLPYGLDTLDSKRRIINSYSPTVGAVAVMAVGSYGHVGVVTSVNGNGTITVDESNYRSCQFGTRTGTPANLRVLGYFKP